jgi:hypothetical protein
LGAAWPDALAARNDFADRIMPLVQNLRLAPRPSAPQFCLIQFENLLNENVLKLEN